MRTTKCWPIFHFVSHHRCSSCALKCVNDKNERDRNLLTNRNKNLTARRRLRSVWISDAKFWTIFASYAWGWWYLADHSHLNRPHKMGQPSLNRMYEHRDNVQDYHSTRLIYKFVQFLAIRLYSHQLPDHKSRTRFSSVLVEHCFWFAHFQSSSISTVFAQITSIMRQNWFQIDSDKLKDKSFANSKRKRDQ